MSELRFASRQIDLPIAYLAAHPEVSDELFSGGDPLVMPAATIAGIRRKEVQISLPVNDKSPLRSESAGGFCRWLRGQLLMRAVDKNHGVDDRNHERDPHRQGGEAEEMGGNEEPAGGRVAEHFFELALRHQGFILPGPLVL